MPKFTHLCLHVVETDFYCPEAFSIELKLLSEKVKPCVEIARRLNGVKDFRHVEFDFDAGDWLIGANLEILHTVNPLEAGRAINCSEDWTSSIRTNGHFVEFRCYEADTGVYSWTEPIFLRGDQVIFRNLAYNLLTGEVTEVDDVQ